MAHVGVKRLRPGDGEEHRAQHDKADDAVAEQKLQAVDRIEGEQNARRIMDMHRAKHADAEEEHRHDRAEEARRRAPCRGSATQNSEIRMTMVARQNVRRETPASASSRPSSADSTEIAGVMMASPENSAAPATPRKNTVAVRWPSACWASAISDSMPPSPLLSARIRNRTYLAVTVKNSAQSSKRHSADHAAVGDAAILHVMQRLAQRVERAGADVAEHDAERPEGESGDARSCDGDLGGRRRRAPQLPANGFPARSAAPYTCPSHDARVVPQNAAAQRSG